MRIFVRPHFIFVHGFWLAAVCVMGGQISASIHHVQAALTDVQQKHTNNKQTTPQRKRQNHTEKFQNRSQAPRTKPEQISPQSFGARCLHLKLGTAPSSLTSLKKKAQMKKNSEGQFLIRLSCKRLSRLWKRDIKVDFGSFIEICLWSFVASSFCCFAIVSNNNSSNEQFCEGSSID